MAVVIDLIVIFLLIVLNGLFALSEMALVSSNRSRLGILEAQGVRGAARARRLAEDPQRFLPAVQVGLTLIGILSGAFGGARLAASLTPVLSTVPTLAPFSDTIAVSIVVVAITYFTLVIGELVPKQIALQNPERLAASAAGPLEFLARITGPLVWLLGVSSFMLMHIAGIRRTGQQTVSEEEIKALLVEGEQTGVLETEERDMIERVLRLADKPVRAIMTPRNEVAWVDITDSQAEIAATLKERPRSRFVVCDGSIDNVVGVVQTKTILDTILDGRPLSIADALRQPIVMPDTVTALDALERLRADDLGMALVMDEYGSFEGLVTAHDLLEAIVGDPESAAPAPDRGSEADVSALMLDGMMPVDEVKARLGLPSLPSTGTYHTLAGLVLALLRRVPREGDRIVFGGWLFEVAAMDGRRVERVRASREPLAEG
ncbi:MAG: HlyC/CorC family transporter [Acetobacteraceae bacterium]|nr:HlyC/CorC family transporter [Acetobacteraceae bacterium]